MVNKQVLLSAIAGIATLGFSMGAVAGGDVPASCTNCANGGFYVGGSVGYGNNRWNNRDGSFSIVTDQVFLEGSRSTRNHTGFAGGINLGYAFNQYFALEAGWMYLPRAKQITEVAGFTPAGFVDEVEDVRIRNYAFDLVAKASAPLDCLGLENVSVFGKAGVAYLRSSVRGGRSVGNTNLTYGFGAAWEFMPSLVADVTFQRFNGEPRVASSKYQPNMDTYTVGLTYKLDGLMGGMAS